jgi:hypothetical protein
VNLEHQQSYSRAVAVLQTVAVVGSTSSSHGTFLLCEEGNAPNIKTEVVT